jgi:dienelactone hydrolase
LSGVTDPDNDIKCPECGAWISAASLGQRDWGDDGERPNGQSGSNTGLWIGLAIGGGVLFLLILCGGIGTFVWYMGRKVSAQQAQLQAAQAQFGAVGGQVAMQPIFVPPTEFPPQTEDYSEARKKFKTKLIQEGPAPQTEDPRRPLHLPPEATEIEYKSGDLQLRAWVSKDFAPANEKKPAVLFLHNGFAFGTDDWEMIQPLLKAGYVVMVPMLRGENNQLGNFSLFYDEVDDVLAAADALEKLPYVDGKRMYLAGHSNGGTLTLLTALTTKRFRAAAAFSPSTDQVNWDPAARSNMGGYAGNQFAGAPFDVTNQKEFQMRSPLAYAESFKCPVRMFFGNQEPFFKACNEKTAEVAKKKKLDVEAIEVPGDHLTSVSSAMPQCIEFFKKH